MGFHPSVFRLSAKSTSPDRGGFFICRGGYYPSVFLIEQDYAPSSVICFANATFPQGKAFLFAGADIIRPVSAKQSYNPSPDFVGSSI